MVAGATPESLYALRERGFLDMRPAQPTAEALRARKRAAGRPSEGDASMSIPPSGWGNSPNANPETPATTSEDTPHVGVADHAAPPPTPQVRAEAAPIEALARIRWARTPAATKLYLMDVVERTFAASDRAQWEQLRELLREVRDEHSLSVAMDIVTRAIGHAAGEDRAQALRQQLVL